jgi:hypothetical protein
VFRALRDYFWMCNQARRKMVAMSSQVVDEAWREFILFTRAYQEFCSKALGRFLHHTPTEAMKAPTLAQEDIQRAWRLACARERLNPSEPGKLPLIFGIDALLDIPDGFVYVPNCREPGSPGYGAATVPDTSAVHGLCRRLGGRRRRARHVRWPVRRLRLRLRQRRRVRRG